MRPDRPILYLARVTLELDSAAHFGASRPSATDDAPLAVDALGLPYIPGASLAGVWKRCAPEKLRAWFGGESSSGEAKAKLEISALSVGPARLHDAKDRPIERWNADAHNADPIVALFMGAGQKVQRRRTAHDPRGVAAHRQLFDVNLVPKGCRFTFEASLETRGDCDDDFQLLLGALASSQFRVGGLTRAGLGRVKVVRAGWQRFDLQTPEGRKGLAAVPRRLSDTWSPKAQSNADQAAAQLNHGFHHGLQQAPAGTGKSSPQEQPNNAPSAAPAVGTLSLETEDFISVTCGKREETGKTTPPHWRSEHGKRFKPADLLLHVEPVVCWKENQGATVATTVRHFVIPASSVKGVLRHRTHFHLCRLCGAFAGAHDSQLASKLAEVERKIETLFGAVGRRRRAAPPSPPKPNGGDPAERTTPDALAGALFIDDAWVKESEVTNVLASGRGGQDDASTLGVRSDYPEVGPAGAGGGAAQYTQHIQIALSRFEQAPIDGALAQRELLANLKLVFPIAVHPRAGSAIDPEAIKAFQLALEDLCDGRLAIGGGGYGFCRGSVDDEFKSAVGSLIKANITANAAEPPPPAAPVPEEQVA